MRRIDKGNDNLTVQGLIILETGKGPTNLGANFRERTLRGRLAVDSITL